MSWLGEAQGGRAGGRFRAHIFAAKFENSLRETLNPLISLKTAKFRVLGHKQIKDLANPAISLVK